MNRKHGITGPISLTHPSPINIKKSSIISTFLHTSLFYESLTDSQTRERVLGIIHHIAKKHFSSRVHTFGSYRLGVHQQNSDIDTLIIAPRIYTHADFFTKFYNKLSTIENITNMQKVEDAYVPLIKFNLSNISIDLVFARSGQSSVTSIDLLDDTLLKDMDDKSIISINGCRVTDMLIKLVPSTTVFHTALRCIKYWAKRRGIYGNSYGYFGGVSYAICVARICQFYPHECAYTIILKFFELYANWEWPNPVLLCANVNRNYGLRVWDPKINYADRFHKMPVITPAYPAMCSTHNVGNSTMALMTEEFRRGAEVLKNGMANYDSLFVDNNQNTELEQNKLCVNDKTLLNNTVDNERCNIEDNASNLTVTGKDEINVCQKVFCPMNGSVESKSDVINKKNDDISLKTCIAQNHAKEGLDLDQNLVDEVLYSKTGNKPENINNGTMSNGKTDKVSSNGINFTTTEFVEKNNRKGNFNKNAFDEPEKISGDIQYSVLKTPEEQSINLPLQNETLNKLASLKSDSYKCQSQQNLNISNNALMSQTDENNVLHQPSVKIINPITINLQTSNKCQRPQEMNLLNSAHMSQTDKNNVSDQPSVKTINNITENLQTSLNTQSNEDIFQAHFLQTLSTLTKQTSFFKTYKSYLQIKVTANNTWSSYVESKIRHLCAKIETTEQYASAVCVQAFPYPSGFEIVLDNKKSVNFFVGIKYESKIKVNIDRPVKDFKQMILEWEKNDGYQLDVVLLKKKDVGCFLKKYYEQVDGKKMEDQNGTDNNEIVKRRKCE